MKKVLFIAFTSALLLLSYLLFNIYQRIEQSKRNIKKSDKLKNFVAKKLNNTPFNSHQVLVGKPIIIVFFNTECEHCHNEIEEISIHQEALKNTTLLFISVEELNAMVVLQM